MKMKMTWKEKRRLGKLEGFRNIIPWIPISNTKHHIEFTIRVWYSQCLYDVHNPYTVFVIAFAITFQGKNSTQIFLILQSKKEIIIQRVELNPFFFGG